MDRTLGRLALVTVVAVIAAAGCGRSDPVPTRAPSGAPATPRASTVATPASTPASTPVASATSESTPLGSAGAVTWSLRSAIPQGWALADGVLSRSEHVHLEILADRSLMAGDCALGPEAGVGATAGEIVGGLATRDGLGTSTPSDARIGGLSGRQIDLTIETGWTGTCPWWDQPGSPVVPLVGTFDAKHYWLFNALTAGESIRYLVLDVPGGGNVVVAVTAVAPETLQDHVASAMDLLADLQFTVSR